MKAHYPLLLKAADAFYNDANQELLMNMLINTDTVAVAAFFLCRNVPSQIKEGTFALNNL